MGVTMTQIFGKSFFWLSAMFACTLMSLGTGCASGGFKLTRQYAGFVNKQDLIIRIVLYLLTGIVFAVTLMVDMVLFNTMDFWEGRVSAGDYKFNDGGKTFQVRHEYQPDSNLKKSTILVSDAKGTRLQEVILKETISSEIEMYIDGKLRSRVRNISDMPVAAIYKDGKFVEDKLVPMQELNRGTVAAH